MKIGIMQPYFMPYFSYFKLIAMVDKFIILDDVNYHKKGWINRNQILVRDNAYMLTLPLEAGSQNKKINELNFSKDSNWQEKFLKTIKYNYRKAPQFENIFPLLEKIVRYENLNTSEYISNSLLLVCNYLEIKTDIVSTSSTFNNVELSGEARILDICNKNNCSEYFNLIGGENLYSHESFRKKNIDLKFLEKNDISYKQFNDKFIADLSIIDYLMFNERSLFYDHCGII